MSLAAYSGPRFENEGEGRLRCPPDPGESDGGEHVAGPGFAGLRAECQADLLGAGTGCAEHRRTVETHVARVYAKFNVHTRGQLVRALAASARPGLDGDQ